MIKVFKKSFVRVLEPRNNVCLLICKFHFAAYKFAYNCYYVQYVHMYIFIKLL